MSGLTSSTLRPHFLAVVHALPEVRLRLGGLASDGVGCLSAQERQSCHPLHAHCHCARHVLDPHRWNQLRSAAPPSRATIRASKVREVQGAHGAATSPSVSIPSLSKAGEWGLLSLTSSSSWHCCWEWDLRTMGERLPSPYHCVLIFCICVTSLSPPALHCKCVTSLSPPALQASVMSWRRRCSGWSGSGARHG